MILISGYQNDLYDDILTESKGWAKSVISTHTGDVTGKKYARKEILWMNSKFRKAKEENKILIRLNKKERKDGKINPPRKY